MKGASGVESQPDDQPAPLSTLSLQELVEQAPDGFIAVDGAGRIRLDNRQTESLFGYSRFELLGRELETLLPQRLRAVHREHRDGYASHPYRRPMGTGMELMGLRKDGTEFPADVSLSALESEAGTLYVAAVRDITERRAAQEALRQANERLRSAFEDGPLGMAVVGLDGVTVEVNQALSGLLGRPADELLSAATPLLTSGALPVSARVLRGIRSRRGKLPREERGVGRAARGPPTPPPPPPPPAPPRHTPPCRSRTSPQRRRQRRH